MIDFTGIDYLKKGNERQKLAHRELNDLNIFHLLAKYSPLLTGTIPIEIDLPESDLDIICQCDDHDEFSSILKKYFSDMENFEIYTHDNFELTSTIARFKGKYFDIEIFGQNCPTQEQNAYRHMIIEHKVLEAKDDKFKTELIKLKQKGYKTEPAFAKLLGLEGDPYKELLNYSL